MTSVRSAFSRSIRLLGSLTFGLGLAFFATAPACSSDNVAATGDGGGACPTAAPASGADDRCSNDGGPIKREATTCPTSAGDAGSADTDGGADAPYPDPHNGTAAADDDCKYDVTYALDCPGRSTTFTLTIKSRATGMPVTAAAPRIEASKGITHPLPNPEPVTTEIGNGVYKIAGVPFDAMGTWTVRFHFFETCLDTEETSKHAHVAFSVNVP